LLRAHRVHIVKELHAVKDWFSQTGT
jgi:hypothetical protein